MTSFECDWALAVAAAVWSEPVGLFISPNPFEMAPEPMSAKETLSNTKNRPIKRGLEKAN